MVCVSGRHRLLPCFAHQRCVDDHSDVVLPKVPHLIAKYLLLIEVVFLREKIVVGAHGGIELWRLGVRLLQAVMGEKLVELVERVETGGALKEDLGVGALTVDSCGLPHGERDEEETSDADDDFNHEGQNTKILVPCLSCA